MKFLGSLRIQHWHQIILSPTDQSDDIDFVEKNATVFAELIQYLDDKNLSLVIRDARDNGRKALTILRECYLSKGKPKVISLYTELISLRRLESGFITDYIIRTENISNTLKEAGEVIRHLIAMVIRCSNFELFTTVITQKKKNLTFSEFKEVMKKQSICVTPPPDQSNNILQMKTIFKKINPQNKPGVSMHSHYDYKPTNYNYNNYQKLQQGQISFVTFVEGEATKHYWVKIEGKMNFVTI